MQSNYNSNNVIIIQTTLKKESEIDIDKKKQIYSIPISKCMLNNRYSYSGFFGKKLLSWRALSG